ncbi:hypothetical protein Bca4012_064111 [Brassica carinata]
MELAGQTTGKLTQEDITTPLRFDDRSLPQRSYQPTSRRTSPRREIQNHGYSGHSIPERPPRPVNDRELGGSASKEAASQSFISPPSNNSGSHRKNSISSRLSDPRPENVGSEDRVSTKERLSVQTQRTSKTCQADSSSNSKRLQEAETRYLEITPIPPQAFITTCPSSSNVFESGRLGPCERSPIRTLSEDQIHVSLR